MKKSTHTILAAGLAAVVMAGTGWAAALTPEVKAKVDAKAKELAVLGKDPAVVAAVKAHNSSPSTQVTTMTDEKWHTLSMQDPFVKSLASNQISGLLRAKKVGVVTDYSVSGADGTKVAFLRKTSDWSDKGKVKHSLPMCGLTWVGPVETDSATGQEQIQVGVPVLDGGKPIGSLIIGLGLNKL